MLVPRGSYRLEKHPERVFTPADEERLRQKAMSCDFRHDKGTFLYNINKAKNNLLDYFANIRDYISN